MRPGVCGFSESGCTITCVKRRGVPLWHVYCYRCRCNKCQGRDVYVGTAKWGFGDRHKSHVRVAQKLVDGQKFHAQAFDHFMAKHGIERLEIRLLGIFVSAIEMFEAEIRLIVEHQTSTTFGGLNVHPGGKGGAVAPISSQTCDRISAGLKALHARDPDFRKHSLAGRRKWASEGNNASERAKKAWETKRKRQAKNPEFAAKQHADAVERGKRGRAVQLLTSDVPSDVEATCRTTTSESGSTNS